MTNLNLGDTLNNGATLLMASDDCLLAVWEKARGKEYIVWDYYVENGNTVTHNGRYFNSFKEAFTLYKDESNEPTGFIVELMNDVHMTEDMTPNNFESGIFSSVMIFDSELAALQGAISKGFRSADQIRIKPNTQYSK